MLRGALLFSLLAASVARGELVWKDAVQEFQRMPEDRELAISFGFTNSGPKDVTVTKINSSCGCTTAELPQKTYRSGEAGKVTAKFTFEGRRGLQAKTITVLTDDGKSTVLAFKCLIAADPVSLTSSLVFWRVGEAATAKEVQVAVGQKPQIEITAVASSNPRISAALTTMKAGEKYAVSIRPLDTAKPESGEIFVQTNFPPEGPKAYTIHVRVK